VRYKNLLIVLVELLALTPVWAGVAAPPSSNVEANKSADKSSDWVTATTAQPPAKPLPTQQVLPADTATARGDANRNTGSIVGMRTRPNSDESQMKCWQNGRLIFDKRVKVLPVDVGAVNRVKDAETGADILTFDLKNAMCVVQ